MSTSRSLTNGYGITVRKRLLQPLEETDVLAREHQLRVNEPLGVLFHTLRSERELPHRQAYGKREEGSPHHKQRRREGRRKQ